jgi:hypothetical protein
MTGTSDDPVTWSEMVADIAKGACWFGLITLLTFWAVVEWAAQP